MPGLRKRTALSEARADRVAIVGGSRTPFVKAGTEFRGHSALDLAVHSVNGLIERYGLTRDSVQELAFGIVVVNPRMPHLARELVFHSTLPPTVRALTVTDNCITGISAIAAVYDAISSGRASCGIAGGVESMSNPPVLFGEQGSGILLDAAHSKSTIERLKALLRLRPSHFKPSPPALAEPSTGLSMGEHCELMVKEWNVSRSEQDEVAMRSHLRAYAATLDGRLKQEISPLDGIDHDLLIRSDSTLQKLATLSPAFDRGGSGTITAGNSTPLTDGAASVLLMSEDWALRHGHHPLAFVHSFEFAGLSPADGLLMGPALTVPRLLRRSGLTLSNIDLVEMHEAFGGQVVCNLKAWRQGWREPAIGDVPEEKLNPLGGSLAVGHPFAATGARIITTLANEMKRRDAKHGLASVCGAGATAAAMLLERD